MDTSSSRRPLASRQSSWAAALTRALATRDITPNQISYAGMVAALIGGAAFWGLAGADGAGRGALLILGALMVQLRLLCNLLDGMVAVEAGKGASDGAFWNEFPDRVSDFLIFVGLGLGLGLPALGFAAAAMAFLTAYVRELGVSCGAGADFSGPMAKPHRMALVTGAAALALFEPLWNGNGEVLRIALWIVALGAGFTALRRSARIVAKLRARA